jgi:hypothetical protein
MQRPTGKGAMARRQRPPRCLAVAAKNIVCGSVASTSVMSFREKRMSKYALLLTSAFIGFAALSAVTIIRSRTPALNACFLDPHAPTLIEAWGSLIRNSRR